jgi:hypothetical protein
MKIRKLGLSLFMLVALLSITPAYSTPFYGYDKGGGDGKWHDANKFHASCVMCWAAAASNILDWGGWGVPTLDTETSIFQDFENHWTDVEGIPLYAWNWWVDGTVLPRPPQQGWATVDVPGGGNHWPSINFWDYAFLETVDDLALTAIDYSLHNGFGTTIGIFSPAGQGHYLTVWGYEYGNASDDYLGLYFTDSDDGVTKLQYTTITWDGTNDWWLFNFYANWHIANVQALAVPEPSSLSLILAGGLGFFYRKVRQQSGTLHGF